MSYGARSDMTPSGTESDREWDEGFEVKGGEGSRRRRKKDEPMKPLTVIRECSHERFINSALGGQNDLTLMSR